MWVKQLPDRLRRFAKSLTVVSKHRHDGLWRSITRLDQVWDFWDLIIFPMKKTVSLTISKAVFVCVAVKLTAVVILCYILCWSPFIFALLWTTFFPNLSEGFSGKVFTILLLLANLNSCTNPWIYLFFSLRKYVRFGQSTNSQWSRRWRPATSTDHATASELDEHDTQGRSSRANSILRKPVNGLPLTVVNGVFDHSDGSVVRL